MDDLERFTSIVHSSDPALDEALAMIAGHGRPHVEPASVIARLDALAELCTAGDARTLCAQLFGPGGLQGNASDYYDPRNSYLDEVLDRHLGIPITLAAIAIEVGDRLGVGLVGIGMPGHFLLRDAEDPDVYFDPFRSGVALDRAACRSVHERLHGSGAPFHEAYLAPTPTLAIVVRVLANLHVAHLRRGERAGLISVLELQTRLPGSGLHERAALADLLASQGRFDRAARLHEELARLDSDPERDHATEALRLWARLN